MSTSPASRLLKRRESESYPLIERLLLRMGYERVYITHGPNELGRDLIFLEHSKLEEEEWRAVQVKRRIRGGLTRPSNLRMLASQCEAALDTPWRAPDGRDIHLKELWLVVFVSIPEATKQTISENFFRQKRIKIIDGPHLDSLLRKHLPNETLDPGQSLNEYLDALATFADSLEDYIAHRFEQRFGLSDVYVRPDASVSYLTFPYVDRIEAIERLDSSKDKRRTESLDEIEKWLPVLVRLGSTGVPAALHLHLTITLRRTLALFEASATLPSPQNPSKNASRLLRDFCTRVGLGFVAEGNIFGRIPSSYRYKSDVERNSFDTIASELAGLTNERILGEILDRERKDKGKDKGNGKGKGKTGDIRALSLQGAIEASLHPVLVPLVELEWARKQARTEPLDPKEMRKLEARATHTLTRLFEFYRTSVDYEDPLADVAIKAARLLSQHVEYQGSLARDHYEKKERELLTELEEVRRYWNQLRSLVLDKLKTLRALSRISDLGPNEVAAGQVHELQMLSGLVMQLWELPAEAFRESRVDAVAFSKQSKALIVEAELGLGKTTLLKRIAIEYSQEKAKDVASPTPFFVRLARVASTPKISEAVLKEAGEADAGIVAGESDGGNVWLLDGFDEVQNEDTRNGILEWVSNAKKDRDKLIVTSRLHALPPFLPGFVRIRLERFSPARVEDLVRAFPWQREGQDLAFLSALEGNKDLRELAEVPLLLTLLLLVARSAGVERIPRARRELYELIVDLFLGEWDLSKGVSKVRAIGNETRRKRALEKVAFGLYARGHRFFGIEQFVEEFDKVWVDEGDSVGIAIRFFSELVRDCVIVPESREVFGFFHLSMQEYLAAKELASDIDARRVVRAVREFCRKDGWWEEVLVFYAALKGDIAVLLEDLHEKVTPPILGGTLKGDFMRLLRRMLTEASFTNPAKTKAHGEVAAALAAINFGGRRHSWRRMR